MAALYLAKLRWGMLIGVSRGPLSVPRIETRIKVSTREWPVHRIHILASLVGASPSSSDCLKVLEQHTNVR